MRIVDHDHRTMRIALTAAQAAAEAGETPVGAVIVDEASGEVIAVGGMGVADWPLVWGLLFGTLGIMHAGLIVGLGAMSARPENRAVGLGIFYITYYLGGTVIPMICGAAAQWMGDASGAFLCAAVLTALALPFWWLHRRLSK